MNLQLYVPERKVYPKGRTWIHEMIYDKARRNAELARKALEQNFHDIATIWQHGGKDTGIYERHVCIYRTRDLWNEPGHLKTHMAARWAINDPMIMFPDIVFDFSDYKRLWWQFLNVDDQTKTHYTRLKFRQSGIIKDINKINGSENGGRITGSIKLLWTQWNMRNIARIWASPVSWIAIRHAIIQFIILSRR